MHPGFLIGQVAAPKQHVEDLVLEREAPADVGVQHRVAVGRRLLLRDIVLVVDPAPLDRCPPVVAVVVETGAQAQGRNPRQVAAFVELGVDRVAQELDVQIMPIPIRQLDPARGVRRRSSSRRPDCRW